MNILSINLKQWNTCDYSKIAIGQRGYLFLKSHAFVSSLFTMRVIQWACMNLLARNILLIIVKRLSVAMSDKIRFNVTNV